MVLPTTHLLPLVFTRREERLQVCSVERVLKNKRVLGVNERNVSGMYDCQYHHGEDNTIL